MNPSPDIIDNLDINTGIDGMDRAPADDATATAQTPATTQEDSEIATAEQGEATEDTATEKALDSTEAELNEAQAEVQESQSDASTLLELVTDTTNIIVETVTTASNVIATNPETVDNIVSDATDALATTAAIATGAPPAPLFGRLFASIASLIRNLFHLFDKARTEPQEEQEA